MWKMAVKRLCLYMYMCVCVCVCFCLCMYVCDVLWTGLQNCSTTHLCSSRPLLAQRSATSSLIDLPYSSSLTPVCLSVCLSVSWFTVWLVVCLSLSLKTSRKSVSISHLFIVYILTPSLTYINYVESLPAGQFWRWLVQAGAALRQKVILELLHNAPCHPLRLHKYGWSYCQKVNVDLYSTSSWEPHL